MLKKIIKNPCLLYTLHSTLSTLHTSLYIYGTETNLPRGQEDPRKLLSGCFVKCSVSIQKLKTTKNIPLLELKLNCLGITYDVFLLAMFMLLYKTKYFSNIFELIFPVKLWLKVGIGRSNKLGLSHYLVDSLLLHFTKLAPWPFLTFLHFPIQDS